jgi:hypothetical protein
VNDSIAQQLVAYLNSRMPRPEQVRDAVRAPMQGVGDAGAALRSGGRDAMLGVMQFLTGHRPPIPAPVLPSVNRFPVENASPGGVVPPHYIGVRG